MRLWREGKERDGRKGGEEEEAECWGGGSWVVDLKWPVHCRLHSRNTSVSNVRKPMIHWILTPLMHRRLWSSIPSLWHSREEIFTAHTKSLTPAVFWLPQRRCPAAQANPRPGYQTLLFCIIIRASFSFNLLFVGIMFVYVYEALYKPFQMLLFGMVSYEKF